MNVSKTHTTNASLKWFLLTIAIISIALLSYPANAETGSITVSNETSANWTRPEVYNGYTIIQNDKLENFTFDTGNFTSFVNFTMFDPWGELTYAQPNEVTTFQITTNGSGHGVASYSQFLRRLNWVCSADCIVTDQYFKVTYDKNIFINVSSSGGVGNGWDFVPSLIGAPPPANNTNNTMPMYVYNGTQVGANFQNRSLLGYDKAPNTRRLILSGIFSSGTVTNYYNITYPNNGYYLATITKTGQTVKTKDFLHTQTNNSYGYYAEVNYNTNDFQVLMPQLDGIYLNVTMGTGDFNNVLINASGTSGIIPGATPNASNPNSANCPVNCITTSKPTYNNTESVNVYGSFYPATTTVTECLFFGFICEDKTISTESTTGYVFISTQGSTSPIKFLSFTPDMNNNYNLFTNLNIGTYQAQLWGFAGPGSTCTNGIVYDFPFVPLGCYYPHNITSFSVVNASGNLSIVWQTKISNSTAIYGDTITVAWNNVTANDTVVIYDNDGAISQSYNINQSTVKQIPVFIPLYSIGTWNATIYNASNHNHNVSAYLNVVPPGSVDVNNSYGITMYWSKAADVVNNPTFLNWNTGTYTGRYNISILQNGNEIRRNSYYGVPGQEQQASYTFGEQGAYIAQFLDWPNGTVQAQADIFISATTSTSGGTGGSTVSESGNNLVGASNLIINIPWIGLMLLIVVIFGLVKNNVQGGNFVFAIAITTSIEAVIGLWEEWGIYITVLSWLLVAVFFRLNKTIEV